MAAAFTEEQIDVFAAAPVLEACVISSSQKDDEAQRTLTDLGIWLAGFESFISSRGRFFSADGSSPAPTDFNKEFRLVYSSLQRCSMLVSRLLAMYAIGTTTAPEIEAHKLDDLARKLRRLLLAGPSHPDSASLSFSQWSAWCTLLLDELRAEDGCVEVMRFADEVGAKFLPPALSELVNSTAFLSAENAELAMLLPRFGRLLRCLDVIGRMLEADEPLKPALLVFARVNEQIFDLTSYINGRLESYPDQESEIFASLDAASYTASLELKKVYSQELAGLASVRQSPSVYARMETAYALLNETFQLILAGFAGSLNVGVTVFDLFPNFEHKREQSMILKTELASVVSMVQATEKDPQKPAIDELNAALRSFMTGSAKYLFYKDTETVERFIEEILVSKQDKELVPTLHRFGAFLETLYGQVSLRAVLGTEAVARL